MRAVIQRVSSSWVKIEGHQIAQIQKGYNILLGIVKGDTIEDVDKLIKKILNLRLFPNEEGKMDKNILQVQGEILVVSQFTLAASIKRGNRPDFGAAAPPEEAKRLYELFCQRLQEYLPLQTGEFGAMMEVGVVNDGPVTIIADSGEL
ncbi:MAG: D-tyrosyl-tRNA(Tyr) deacylase [Epsilonproteobacteria bacterium]|nr:D-tyrosyl-tRNA(Tyr) deacylase [Campylobacterota bacterium]NPA63544.1 D-tyrosyl-tRNA(Tyr) deacylase [Campylobacterota bacterium]